MLAFKSLCRLIFREAAIFLVKNWFNLLLIIGFFQLLSQNQMDFEFTIKTNTINDQFSNRPLREPISLETRIDKSKRVESSMSLGSFSLISKKSDNEITNQISDKTAVKNESDQSFLSFIFYHDSTGEHPIDSALLEYQYSTCQKYIKRFSPVAVIEMHKFGIPASIKLAQALLESNVGTNQQAVEFNNHFGIKCFSKNCGNSHCFNSVDGSYRSYENAWTSFRNHSLFLQNEKYKHLNAIGTFDYKNWAISLENAGYSSDKNYAEKLIKIIEFFNLNQFDDE